MSCLEGANFSGLGVTSVISTKTDISNQVSFSPLLANHVYRKRQ